MARPLDVTDIVRAEGKESRLIGSALHTPYPDAFQSVVQPKASYFTTGQFARHLGISDKTVHRWCQQWYGQLPAERVDGGKVMGYRIHPFMVRVARGWLQTRDRTKRDSILRALREASRPWVVLVGRRATTHYTVDEALEVVRKTTSRAPQTNRAVTVLYVGDPAEDGREQT